MPIGVYPRACLLVRFWAKVSISPGCWEWTGGLVGGRGLSGKRYGQISSRRAKIYAHVLSWEIENKTPVPNGICVLHRCDTPACVNPGHLFLGTLQDNHRDMVQKGRQMRGEKHYRAKLSESDVREIRSSTEATATLARRYGLSRSAIGGVRYGKNWRHVS